MSPKRARLRGFPKFSVRRRVRPWLVCAPWFAALCIGRSVCAAQSGDMGQGEANIAVRSDVKLAVKGTGGTPSERLSKLGQAVSDEMGDIRACYHDLVAKTPEVTGMLRLRLGLEQDKAPSIEWLAGNDDSKPMVQCVAKVLTRAKYRDVGRPAAAFLTMTFDNSRARGESEMKERSAEIAQVQVSTNLSGAHQASWSTNGDEVRFTAKSDVDAPTAAVSTILQGFKRGYAAFLDCRRKCEQGGASPEGDIDARLVLDTKGKAKVTLGKITVAHQRAPGCADRAFKRVTFDKPSQTLEADVRVHFAP
jgi:hypothetical protein